MCGIVGFITTESAIGAYDRKRWFVNALRADVVRGEHGTGVFFVRHKQGTDPVDWCKIGNNPDALLNDKAGEARLGDAVRFDDFRAVIGHNRAATIGNVSTANAHPFQEGPITLVHNGTLNTMHNLPTKKGTLHKDVSVDSHVICHNLATHSVEEVIGKLDGAFVLVWHDSRDQSVNIIRNVQRPIHLLPLKYHHTILLASEAEMLWWLTQRSPFHHDDTILRPEPGQLLKFLPGTGAEGLVPTTTRIKLVHEYPKNYVPWSGRGNYGRAWDYDEYDDIPYADREGSNTGKVPRAPHTATGEPFIDQKALDRKIPRPIVKTLDQYDLNQRDKLRMAVTAVTKVHGTNNAIVIGRLIDLEPQVLTMHLYGLLYDAVLPAASNHETWTVAPVGMKSLGQGSPVVLGRLLARSSTSRPAATTTPPTETSPSSEVSSPASSTSEDDVTEEEWNRLPRETQLKILNEIDYYDPHGSPVEYDEWLNLVAGGCDICTKKLDPFRSDEMLWDSENLKPICAECAPSVDLTDDGETLYG